MFANLDNLGKVIPTDVLIIGGGLSAMFAGIEAKKAGVKNVVIVDKCQSGKSGCSVFAAGVMGVYFPTEDNFDDWLKEAVIGSEYLTDQEQLADHLANIYSCVKEMDSFGVNFRKIGNNFERGYGRGATAETRKKMIMFNGGMQMMDAMKKAAEKYGLRFVNRVMVTDLLIKNGLAAGAVGFDTTKGDFYIFPARVTILASGSCRFKGMPPGHRTNTGDLAAAGYRAGAEMVDFCFTQYNAFPARYDIGPGMNMYVGLGGRFTNAKGEPFMAGYDPVLKDSTHLPRLAAAMSMEAKQGNTPVFMDMTHFSGEAVNKLRAVLPLPVAMYEAAGIIVNNRFVKKIEWMVAGPDVRGGFKIDREFRTTIPGLFACGDAASRSLTQVNNALPGAATSGKLAGKSAARFSREADLQEPFKEQILSYKEWAYSPMKRKEGLEPDQVVLSLQEAIAPFNVLILRSEQHLTDALKQVEDIRDTMAPYLCAYDPHFLRMAIEARNMVCLAEIMVRSALARKESRGYLREDYPYTDNESWLKWVVAERNGDKMEITTEDIPVKRFPVKPPEGKFVHPIWEAAIKKGLAKLENGAIRWV